MWWTNASLIKTFKRKTKADLKNETVIFKYFSEVRSRMELTADIIYLLEVAFLVLTIAVLGRTKEPYIFLQRSLCFKSKHVPGKFIDIFVVDKLKQMKWVNDSPLIGYVPIFRKQQFRFLFHLTKSKMFYGHNLTLSLPEETFLHSRQNFFLTTLVFLLRFKLMLHKKR